MGCRPSEVHHITDPYVAYCFDEAVTTFGNYILNKLHDAVHDSKADRKAAAKQERLLRKLLGEPQKFRSPTPTVKE